MAKKEPLSTGVEWDFELLYQYHDAIGAIAHDFGLDTYPNQIEVIKAEQMMDAYASTGMPIGYNHWSFGKKYVNVEKQYKRGHMGLAYEIVINSNPCIAYLMEENSICMQALVIAHASFGHNSFFKNNYLFKTWTVADSIIDYLVFAKNYIAKCEEKYGVAEVEEILDSCHALSNYGAFRYKRPPTKSKLEQKRLDEKKTRIKQQQYNDIWRTIPENKELKDIDKITNFPEEPEENILYFIEKHAPLLKDWQREIVRIVRKLSQYFYPQRQTQVMNEGWACFWHYTLLNALYDEGKVTDEFMLEFIQNHTNVVMQLPFDHPSYSGINPYALGFNMMQDIKRIAQNPTDEDKNWFPELSNSNWQLSLDTAMRNFKDESFIGQYLSPTLMRDMKFFSVLDDDQRKDLTISAIHNDKGYHRIRESLSHQYNLSTVEPDLQVNHVDVEGSRTITLVHKQYQRRPLCTNAFEVAKHLHRLWQFPVAIESLDENDKVLDRLICPKPAKSKK